MVRITVEGDGFLPTKIDPLSAGRDVYSNHDYMLAPHSRLLVHLDIKISTDCSTPMYWRVAPRSGLALGHGIDVMAGVVDYGYRGYIGVILYNTGDEVFVIRRGDRIAQLVPEVIAFYAAEVVRGEVDQTERGEKGFGSSGK